MSVRPWGPAVMVVVLASAALAWPSDVRAQAHTCYYCHSLHGAMSAGELLKATTAEAVCAACHDQYEGYQVPGTSITVPQQANMHVSEKYSSTVTCRGCHDHEGEADGNLHLVPGQLDNAAVPSSGLNKSVLFSATIGTNSFADGDLTFDGVCEVCHTQTKFHVNYLVDPDTARGHNARANCATVCHKHDGGFKPSGGCTQCHNSAQDLDPGTTGSRREVVSEFSRTSHHANAVQDGDCEVCHDQSLHQQGAVRLKNADNGGIVYVLSDYADPSTNSTEAAKLTAFCLSCHDSNAAGGANPFSDGATPPVIDNNAWTSSSHNTAGAIAGCFGDGAFGCHATGHGSAKTKLLAPAGTPATAPALVEQEEGFCFNCHDADGPAATDIDGLFSTTVRWVTGAVGANSNVNLNDRHDVQHSVQATSGAKLECTDCHNPHTAKSTAGDTLELLRPDPDPTDGRTPTNVSEWCLDCHDGSFPSTVTAPTTALNDVRTSNLTDAMGAGGGNATLKAGYGWAADDNIACYACHVPHVVNSTTKNNLFHLVEIVKSKDGTTDIPSDNVGLNYAVTDNSVKSPSVNGYEWCNTCHTASMGDKKDNCYACHYHGTRW